MSAALSPSMSRCSVSHPRATSTAEPLRGPDNAPPTSGRIVRGVPYRASHVTREPAVRTLATAATWSLVGLISAPVRASAVAGTGCSLSASAEAAPGPASTVAPTAKSARDLTTGGLRIAALLEQGPLAVVDTIRAVNLTPQRPARISGYGGSSRHTSQAPYS